MKFDKTFPSTTASDWWDKIRKELKLSQNEDLFWQTDEGFAIAPFFMKDDDVYSSSDILSHSTVRRGYPNSTDPSWQTIIPLPLLTHSDTLAYLDYILSESIEAIWLYQPDTQLTIPIDLLNDVLARLTKASIACYLPTDWLAQVKSSYINEKLLPLHGLLPAYELPIWDSTSLQEVDLRFLYNKGSNLTFQLAVGLAVIVDKYDSYAKHERSFSEWLSQTTFHFATGTQLYLEIAKLRAWRIVLGNCLQQLGEPLSIYPAICTHSSTRTLTFEDQYNNIIRNTLVLLGSVLGGSNSICLLPYDMPTKEVSRFSVDMSRNVSLILQEEAHLHHVKDPLGGAYFIEKLTDQMAYQAWTYFLEVERRGGFMAAWKSGWVQDQIDAQRTKSQKAFQSGAYVRVGVNKYRDENSSTIPGTATELY